jgi:hypothetical protein
MSDDEVFYSNDYEKPLLSNKYVRYGCIYYGHDFRVGNEEVFADCELVAKDGKLYILADNKNYFKSFLGLFQHLKEAGFTLPEDGEDYEAYVIMRGEDEDAEPVTLSEFLEADEVVCQDTYEYIINAVEKSKKLPPATKPLPAKAVGYDPYKDYFTISPTYTPINKKDFKTKMAHTQADAIITLIAEGKVSRKAITDAMTELGEDFTGGSSQPVSKLVGYWLKVFLEKQQIILDE